MKDSLELLELIYSDALNFNEFEEDIEEVKREYKIIKQDLERLEVLEKNNQKLYEKVNHFKNVKNRWKRNCKFLEEENKKLKQAIEILKDHFEIHYNRYTDVYELKADLPLNKIITKKTYEILKEVLGNE